MTGPDDLADVDADLVRRLRAEYAALPVDADVRVDDVASAAGRGRRRRVAAVAGAAAAVVLVAGGAAVWTGSGGSDDRPGDPASEGPDDASGFPPAATPYDGPLSAPGRFGAAGQVVDCVNPATGSNRTTDVYAEGATSPTPAGAVETALSEGLFLSMPQVELALAATEPDRRLLTYEVDGTVLLALVVHDGPAAEGTGGDGWYVETFARCDFAEFPEGDAAIPGFVRYGIWTDTDGVPVPVAKVYSSPGPAHCSWEEMTFLFVDEGPGRGESYVEDPIRELRGSVAGPYLTDVPLPDGVRDTGWERKGRHLWLAADGSYAYVGTPESVDAWPRFDSGCL